MFDNVNDRAIETLKKEYPSHYKLNSQSFAIRSKLLADDIARSVGIKGDARFVSGVVFRLNHIYAGYTSASLWDWLAVTE